MKFLLILILSFTNCTKEVDNLNLKFKNLNEQLIAAINERNIDKFKNLISLGADINYIYNGKSVIEYAIKKRNLEIITELLKNEKITYDKDVADKIYEISLTNSYSYPLHLILEKEKLSKKNIIDNSKIFLILCFISNKQIVKNFIKDNNLNPLGIKDESDRNGLIVATIGQKRDIIELLVKNYKLDINSKDKNGNSSLILASAYGLVEEVKFLIELGSNINDKGINGSTALSNSIDNNLSDLAEFLILNGADLEIKDDFGCKPLMCACEEHNIKIIKMLMNKGADINSRDEDGKTALMYALHSKNRKVSEVLKILVEKGANFNEENLEGDSALILACENKNKQAIDFLIKVGADINHKNSSGYTPLMISIKNNIYKVVEALLESGAKINLKNNKGNSALIIAIAKQNFQIVKLLLDYGANIGDKNNSNLNAIEYSEMINNPQIHNLLINTKNHRILMKKLNFNCR